MEDKGGVVHCRRDRYDVYVGRPSKWGNPFKVGVHGKRDECIALYVEWLRTQPELIADAKRELKGKVLGCWCAPNACHAEILRRVANRPG